MKISRRTANGAFLASAFGGGLLTTSSKSAGPTDASAEERLRTQVCVVGGGSGGVGAALAAARAGAQVVLLEREAILGGTSTNAWVHTWEPVSGANGIPRELYAAMKEDPLAVTYADYNLGGHRRGGHGLPFEPRALDFAAHTALAATGRCRTLLGVTFHRTRVQQDRVRAVEAWYPGTHLVIEADVFIDCTADGDVCADAGCQFHLGEDPKSLYAEPSAPEKAALNLNAMTLCYRIKDTGVAQKPYLPKGVAEGSCAKGVHIVIMPNGDHLLNVVDMINGNALLYQSYGEIMHEAHRRVLAHFHWLQRLAPSDKSHWTRYVRGKGYGTWAISGIAPRIGVRETRRILGDYVLTEHDFQAGLRGQKHGDIIAISDHAVDVHGSKSRLHEAPNGPYGVPYRCLLPRGVQNLMIASRAASFSHVAASSCRLSRTIMTLGQAAGNAAALAVKNHVAPRDLDVKILQKALRSQGVEIECPIT